MAANDNAVSCTNKDVTFFSMLAQCIGVDASGNKTLRVHSSASVNNSTGLACGGANDGLNTQASLLELFTYDTNNDLAIRMSIL